MDGGFVEWWLVWGCHSVLFVCGKKNSDWE